MRVRIEVEGGVAITIEGAASGELVSGEGVTVLPAGATGRQAVALGAAAGALDGGAAPPGPAGAGSVAPAPVARAANIPLPDAADAGAAPGSPGAGGDVQETVPAAAPGAGEIVVVDAGPAPQGLLQEAILLPDPMAQQAIAGAGDGGSPAGADQKKTKRLARRKQPKVQP
jgi:hypothetical protein